MYSERYDSFVPNATDEYIWFERTQYGGRGTSDPCLYRCWASVVDGVLALDRSWVTWVGVPCLLGWYPLCVGSVLVHRLRRCPGTAPTLSSSWCLLGFTILCNHGNNVTFWLSCSACFYYLHFGVTYKPKWAAYYIVNIFILSL